MSNVYANGLEVSGKAVDAKTIAAFPDVCFTPPENPATPPGVPIPYPSFGFASDTEQGTSTVKIGGKIVNIKNKSDLSKTSGTEAGCAAKKGVITSKNTGKEYFNSWSTNVKFDGEPVIRFSDLATNNHASPIGNTPPWPHIAKLSIAGKQCKEIYLELEGHPHSRKSKTCKNTETGKESEHTAQAACFMNDRSGKVACDNWKDYKPNRAPCICMEAERINPAPGESPKVGMPHYNKTAKFESFLDEFRAGCSGPDGNSGCAEACEVPTAGEASEAGAKATAEEHPKIQEKPKKKQRDAAADCLSIINLAYLAGVDENDSEKTAKKKVDDAKKKKICVKGVCTGPKDPCHGC